MHLGPTNFLSTTETSSTIRSSQSNNNIKNMKNATFIVASFTHPILPTVQGEPYYHTIHSIIKLLRANARYIETHIGGGVFIHLGIIILIAAYATVAPANPWVNPLTPGWGPVEIYGVTTAQLPAEHHLWEKAVVTLRTWNNVEQALQKEIIMAFEKMHLEILNNGMVGFSNTTARDIHEHLFLSYYSITAVDLEHNFENMRKACDPQQPV
jgi:hypothetical protein